MKQLLWTVTVLWFAASTAFGQTAVTFESAKVSAGEALPGSNAVVTISFKIRPGIYLHSSRPIVPRATATELQLGTTAAARSLPAAFAAGGQKTIPGNAQPVAVYEGGLTVQVPVVIAPNAAFPITLAGVVGYAPVNEKTHVAGRIEQVRFTVTIPRGTNAPPAAAKTQAAPKKK